MLPILIVDDEPHIARLIEMTLEPLGQPLVLACDGEQAADLLEKQQFDLVLLDVMLPGVDGFALMDYIAPTGTPVIFLTAKNAVADRVRGLKLGAYDYIVKPFAPAELLARVEGLLRHTGRRAATLRVFDAEVDPDNRTVTQNGRAVELTPREFTLLLVLVRARGQALYRDILYERVWGPDAEPNPRALDLHIHRLRKKLDWADKIVTVPESVAAADVQQAAAATDGILLRGETLLLGGVLNTPYSYPVAVVTAADASEAFAARNRLLYSWLAVQAVITLAALVAAYHYERLQELNARQSRFVADLTHELKTPLTSLIGYADLLRGGTLDAERRRTAAEALYHESARLESLSQQLLALNGLQADGVVLCPVRVAAAFADAVRSLPDVVLDCDAPAEAVVLADRVLLADLVRNLALNAWHAGPQDGAVHLRCTDAGECWRLTVQDTGCGIPAEALPHLTEPFYRVDKARARANGGSGVGLALCAQITEAFGTQMTFASRVGEGTTVTILLQKEAEHEEAAQQQ